MVSLNIKSKQTPKNITGFEQKNPARYNAFVAKYIENFLTTKKINIINRKCQCETLLFYNISNLHCTQKKKIRTLPPFDTSHCDSPLYSSMPWDTFNDIGIKIPQCTLIFRINVPWRDKNYAMFSGTSNQGDVPGNSNLWSHKRLFFIFVMSFVSNLLRGRQASFGQWF